MANVLRNTLLLRYRQLILNRRRRHPSTTSTTRQRHRYGTNTQRISTRFTTRIYPSNLPYVLYRRHRRRHLLNLFRARHNRHLPRHYTTTRHTRIRVRTTLLMRLRGNVNKTTINSNRRRGRQARTTPSLRFGSVVIRRSNGNHARNHELRPPNLTNTRLYRGTRRLRHGRQNRNRRNRRTRDINSSVTTRNRTNALYRQRRRNNYRKTKYRTTHIGYGNNRRL